MRHLGSLARSWATLSLCYFPSSLVAANLASLKLKEPPTLPPDASPSLNPSLASFSIETAFFEEFFGNKSFPNQLSLNLLQNLKDRTGVPAEIRIGGITADSARWDPTQDVALFNFVDSSGALHNTTLGPAFWQSVGLLPKGTKITLTLVGTQNCMLNMYFDTLLIQICIPELGKSELRRGVEYGQGRSGRTRTWPNIGL